MMGSKVMSLGDIEKAKTTGQECAEDQRKLSPRFFDLVKEINKLHAFFYETFFLAG
jgi:hypothetical protein